MTSPFDITKPESGVTTLGPGAGAGLYAELRALLLILRESEYRDYGTGNPSNLTKGVRFLKEVSAGVPAEYFYDGSQVKLASNLHPEITAARLSYADLATRLAAGDSAFATLLAEVVAARFNASSLWALLGVSMNPDGTMKNPIPVGGWWNAMGGAAYSTTTSFTIAGDQRTVFKSGRALYFVASGGAITYAYVATSSYDGSTYTTVNVNSPAVPNPISSLYYGQEVANAPLTSSWWTAAISPTRTGSQTFTVSGDKRDQFKANTALRYEPTSLTYTFDYVVSSSYSSGTGLTTVTVQGSVPVSFVSIAYGQDPANAPFMGGLSLPAPLMSGLATSAIEGSVQSITISNYDASNTYNIAVSGGSASRTGDTISWTLPAVSSNTDHTITVYASRSGYNNSYSAVQSITVNDFSMGSPTLSASPTSGNEGTVISGTITDYNAAFTYHWSSSPAGISDLTNTGSTWSFTAPAVSSDTDFTISVYATHATYGTSGTANKTISVINIPIHDGSDVVWSINSTNFPDGVFI